MKRTTQTGVISVLLLAACGAWCQEQNPSAVLPQRDHFDGLNAPEAQEQELRAQRSLPDAPSLQLLSQAGKFYTSVEKVCRLSFSAAGVAASVIPDKKECLASGMQPSLTGFHGAAMLRNESTTSLDKYLYRSLLKQDAKDRPSTSSGSFLSRASSSISRILITRNDSGKRTLDTSYLFGVLTSAAVATADRPYWARSPSTLSNNFGSTIGNDVGINFFHEFQPGIQQMLSSHSPKFVKKIEAELSSPVGQASR